MMDPQEISKLSASAQADQRTAFVVNIAADVAAYYKRLLGQVPKALAAELTMQAAAYLWGAGGCGCGEGDG